MSEDYREMLTFVPCIFEVLGSNSIDLGSILENRKTEQGYEAEIRQFSFQSFGYLPNFDNKIH